MPRGELLEEILLAWAGAKDVNLLKGILRERWKETETQRGCKITRDEFAAITAEIIIEELNVLTKTFTRGALCQVLAQEQ